VSEYIAIDPGPVESAWIQYDSARSALVACGLQPNEQVLEKIRATEWPIVCEMIACYGMAVGKETFETVYWIGRFCEAAKGHSRVFRKEVSLYFCNSPRATDSNVRRALLDLDRFGGSEEKAIGGRRCTPCHGRGVRGKKAVPCEICGATGWRTPPGPLYAVKSDIWSALAVAVYFEDSRCEFGEIRVRKRAKS
jgi:hypothetical protein